MDLRYPIGQFTIEQDLTEHQIRGWIREIAQAPENLRQAVDGLTDAQLDTPYRPGGWTVRQVVHHVPDSHMNSYIRFKLALTEDTPKIKPYHENLWAELADSRATPIETSLALLQSLHERWVILLKFIDSIRLQAGLCPSGEWNIAARSRYWPLRVARKTSYSAHRSFAEAHGMVDKN